MINKYNLLVNKFVAKNQTSPALANILVTPKVTCATDRYTLLEVETAPDYKLEDYPIIPNIVNVEIEAHVMPIDAANQLLANLKKAKSPKLPILETASAIKAGDETQAGFVTTNLETASPLIYKKIDDKFPEYQSIMPAVTPVLELNVSPDYLKRIAEVFTTIGNASVNIKFYGEMNPVVFEAKTPQGQRVTALLMPIKS